MTTLEVLKAARDYIRKGWCQGTCARNSNGDSVSITSEEAVSWCIRGACGAAAEEFDMESHYEAARAIEKFCPLPPAVWNDEPERTKDDVIEAFDKAIAAEEAKEIETRSSAG